MSPLHVSMTVNCKQMNICEEITIVWVSIASLSANGLLIIDTMVPSYHPQFTVTPKRNSIIEDEDEFLG